MKRLSVALFLSLVAASTAALDAAAGELAIDHPYALATPPGATTAGAYLTRIDNHGAVADSLLGATSPAAERVELHDMRMDGNVMRMRAVATIVVAPGKPVTMAPGGGFHLMLLGLRKPLAIGDEVPLTLRFERAGQVEVVAHVEARGAAPPSGHAMSMH